MQLSGPWSCRVGTSSTPNHTPTRFIRGGPELVRMRSRCSVVGCALRVVSICGCLRTYAMSLRHVVNGCGASVKIWADSRSAADDQLVAKREQTLVLHLIREVAGLLQALSNGYSAAMFCHTTVQGRVQCSASWGVSEHWGPCPAEVTRLYLSGRPKLKCVRTRENVCCILICGPADFQIEPRTWSYWLQGCQRLVWFAKHERDSAWFTWTMERSGWTQHVKGHTCLA